MGAISDLRINRRWRTDYGRSCELAVVFPLGSQTSSGYSCSLFVTNSSYRLLLNFATTFLSPHPYHTVSLPLLSILAIYILDTITPQSHFNLPFHLCPYLPVHHLNSSPCHYFQLTPSCFFCCSSSTHTLILDVYDAVHFNVLLPCSHVHPIYNLTAARVFHHVRLAYVSLK